MSRSRTPARFVTLIAGLVVSAGLVTVGVPPTAHAIDSPSSLSASEAPIPVLSWERVAGATGYDVQVSRVGDFTTTIVSTSTVNHRYVPLLEMPTGDVWWRVRGKTGSTTGDWTTASFSRSAQAAPVTRQPQADATFTPPQTPRFTWDPVPGATSYTVQTSTDDAFTDPRLIVENKQETTAAYLTGYPEVGNYFWRVRAELTTSYATAWSPSLRYHVAGLTPVARTAPDDVFDKDALGDVFITDVVLDWEPKPGAATYELRIDTDRNFLSVDHSAAGVTGTRYSPPATLKNDDFFWQVRPVNASGKAAPWPDTPWRFTHAWPDQPTPTYPIGAPAPGTPFFYEWDPIERASKYVVHVWNERGEECTATTIHTTLAGECAPDAAGAYRWRVEGIDEGGSNAPHTVSRPQDIVTFTYEPPPVIPAAPGPLPPVTGHATALSGVAAFGLGVPQESCGDDVPDQCDDLRQTPLLTWSPVPGATKYRIVISNDAEGTNLLLTDEVTEPMWTSATSLADSQAGSAYFWKVLPCAGTSCSDPIEFRHAFAKESLAPTPLSPVDDAEVRNDVTLEWGSLLGALRDPAAPASDIDTPADTDAKQYVVQISLLKNDSGVFETRTVDQTTYTSFTTTYPEGPVYWRVAAIDGSGKQTVFSDWASFVKRSPVPTLLTPADGAPLGQDYTLSWEPLNFAKSYEIEVYAGPTRVATATTGHTSWAPSVPFPASASAYTWRVRRVDAAGRVGAWSDHDRPAPSFRFEGFTPSQAAPPANAVVAPSGGLFSWEPDPRATSYRFERRKPGSTTDMAETVSTRATAWAPTLAMAAGTAQWRVTALDTAGRALGSSPWRNLVVVDPPAVTTPVTISGSGRIGSDLRLSAPSFDPAVTATTYQWYRGGSAITGATEESYTLTSSDLDKLVTVRATGTLAGFMNATSTSNAIMGVTGDAPVATSPPSITGAPKFAETLAVTPGTWPGNPTLKYQWYRDGVPISQADDPTYKLVAADVDHLVHVVETASLGGRTPGAAPSDPVTPVAGDAPVATTAPKISPSSAVTVGSRLTVTKGTWTPSAAYTYQWFRDDVAIPGASATTYTLVAADVDRSIHVVETATAPGRLTGTAASSAVVPNGVVAALTPPTITGAPIAGRIVTADPGTWSSTTTPTFRYQWFVDGTSVTSSSSSPSYSVKGTDATRRLHVVVTATTSGYQPGTAPSAPVTVTTEGPLVASVKPSIAGTTAVGNTLTANPGTWSRSASYAYQWYRNGARINGATNSRYSVTAADAARRLHVVVTATASYWTPGTAASPARAIAKMASASTLSLSTTKTTAKKRVTATVRVSVSGLSSPGGTVTLYDGSRRLATVKVSSSGTATYKLPKLKAGKHTIKAVYSGSTQVNGSTRTAKLTVTKR